MARNDKKGTKPEKGFSTTPFAALKGVTVAAPAPAEKMAPVKKTPEPPAAADDSSLFLRAMADVRRLREDRQQQIPKPKAAAATPAVPLELFDDEDRRVFLETIGRLKMDVTFRDQMPGTDGKPQAAPGRMRQLKRGTIRIDYELDLHGLTREEAVTALGPFIAGAHRRGQQAVLVITGKGHNSDGEPVLQRAVSAWLRDKGKSLVAEFAPAPRELGGDGALVVFLKGNTGKGG